MYSAQWQNKASQTEKKFHYIFILQIRMVNWWQDKISPRTTSYRRGKWSCQKMLSYSFDLLLRGLEELCWARRRLFHARDQITWRPRNPLPHFLFRDTSFCISLTILYWSRPSTGGDPGLFTGQCVNTTFLITAVVLYCAASFQQSSSRRCLSQLSCRTASFLY